MTARSFCRQCSGWLAGYSWFAKSHDLIVNVSHYCHELILLDVNVSNRIIRIACEMRDYVMTCVNIMILRSDNLAKVNIRRVKWFSVDSM